jgi:riboflavin kinase / FMN adenylyltransferase
MRTMVGHLDTPEGGSVITIGTFDGVHLGHRGLIMRAIEHARELSATAVALTWDRHPAATLRPDKTPPLLSSAERKIELLSDTGVDVAAILAFDEDFSRRSPEEFIEETLVRDLSARAVYVGHDWRFGHKAAGTVDLLREHGERAGFAVHGVELQQVAGAPVSSSRVRAAIGDGDMELARVLLGRPYDVDGIVVRGAARGKELGFPTANLEVESSLARPPLGVYAGLAHVGERRRAAAISVGVNPTFGGEVGRSPVTIEAFLLDFSAEIYGETVRLEFWRRLRDELRFESVEALIEQMHQDVSDTRATVGTT